MDIHKLYIFAKNRDAISALKGYSFQQLKTIRDWVANRVAGRDEVIYCDYEDDIFTRDIAAGTSSFKQIKLYSTDFSFSSDSITKAISHFFMLYVKGDYAFDQVNFTFETNTGIVGKEVKDNDAKLLKEWNEQQDDLSANLVERIRVRIKKILGDYIDTRYADLSKDVLLKPDVQKAKHLYDALQDADFDTFIRCITWRFDNVDPNQAVDVLGTELRALVKQLPMQVNGEPNVFQSLLIAEVHARSTQDNPEDRKLTNALLDDIVLRAGNEEDQWYADTIGDARQAPPVQEYRPGEFQRAVTATRYCRWSGLDASHRTVWLGKMHEYMALVDTPVESKRKAIYEYIFLKTGTNFLRPEPADASDLAFIRFLIDHWEHRNHIRDLDEDITFLQLMKALRAVYAPSIAEEYLAAWEKAIEAYLDDQRARETRPDQRCELLELRGHLEQQKDLKNVEASFDIYRSIIPLLAEARFYSLSTLYHKMDEAHNLLVFLDRNEELQDAFERFKGEIQAHVTDGRRMESAAVLVERGRLHMANYNLRNDLRALDVFHRAKDILRMEDTKGAYAGCLLALSDLYLRLGMCYASKYYATVALWSLWHTADPRLRKFLPPAMALVNIAAFASGAWLQTIQYFGLYLAMQQEFAEKGLSLEINAPSLKTRRNIAWIAIAAPRLHPDMSDIVDGYKGSWAVIWDEQIQVWVDKLQEAENPLMELPNLLSDFPLNDVGPARHIAFTALDIDWSVEFENNAPLTAIGEEFLSFLQIILCEIAGERPDVLRPGHRQVAISIVEGHFQKECLNRNTWRLTIPAVDTNDEETIRMHYVYLGKLIVAVLIEGTSDKREVNALYMRLLEKKGLGSKVLEGTAYQRAFKNCLDTSSLDVLQGADMQAIPAGAIAVKRRQWLVQE